MRYSMAVSLRIVYRRIVCRVWFLLLYMAASLLTQSWQVHAQDFLWNVTSEAEFEAITREPTRAREDVLRVGLYFAPASDDPSLLPTVYQDINVYDLHIDFLREVFPERFAYLDDYEHVQLLLRDTPRQYFEGGIYSFESNDGGIIYGFDSALDWVLQIVGSSELLTIEEAHALYTELSKSFLLRPLAYAPIREVAMERARSWEDPEFPIYLPEGLVQPEYEAYTLGTNYGRVRVLTVEELQPPYACGQFSWQDLLVLDQVPFDIEGVMAGLITGERQGELAHTRIRLARRGTPNAFLESPHEALAPYDGQLVQLTIEDATFSIEASTDYVAAQAWWDEHRPSLANSLLPDLEYSALDNVLEIDVEETDGPLAGKFGGKAAGLAKMYSFLPAEYQVPGFAIPFRYYHEFMTAPYNIVVDGRTQPAVIRTFDEYLASLLEDPQFQTDGQYRCQRLASFREYVEDHGTVDPALVDALKGRIEEVFGSPLTMVRFRSSSNAEDSVQFNGAGLYSSTSVCVEDSLDGDNEGPSECDPNQNNERTIERGLKRVWASLWNFRAYEEREYYQIPQDQVAIGILVTPAFPNEAANGVAFTGDPIGGSEVGYVVNVQIGDHSVVLPDPGVLPELDILEMNSGSVANINRVRGSSLMPEGKWVLDATQLETLGAAMAIVDASMPLDLEGYAREDVLLDIEFKFTQAGQLIFKQVRPFLRSGAKPSPEIMSNPRCDINQDGCVDARDLTILLGDWDKDQAP